MKQYMEEQEEEERQNICKDSDWGLSKINERH